MCVRSFHSAAEFSTCVCHICCYDNHTHVIILYVSPWSSCMCHSCHQTCVPMDTTCATMVSVCMYHDRLVCITMAITYTAVVIVCYQVHPTCLLFLLSVTIVNRLVLPMVITIFSMIIGACVPRVIVWVLP